MAAVTPWAHVVIVGPTGAEITAVVLGGVGVPDLGTVDVLARWQRWARAGGGCLRLRDPCAELLGLLDLVGLRREVGGEPECREQVGVEESVEPGDPTA